MEMSKKSHKKRQKIVFDFDDDFDELYDDDFDLDQLSRDIYSTDWGDHDYPYEKGNGNDARRRIERRRDMRKLYSELDEWEEFGSKSNW
jgi:hypothetical protein